MLKMPAAVTNINDTTEFDLKSLVGGKVTLRPMTYGQVVQRRTLTKLSVLNNTNRHNSVMGEMAMASKEITLFEFAHCIVDHNLEDNDGRKLNLSGPDFDSLNPRVGQEIESLIADMNNFNEETQGN
jgi:hypothetical protein